MNKEITIYELLGLVKDGQAPKRIIETQSGGLKEEYILDNDGWYTTIDGTTKMNIFEDDRLNDKVQIIEEDKKIEKFSPCLGGIMSFESVEHIFEIYEDEINYLIDEVNKLKEDK